MPLPASSAASTWPPVRPMSKAVMLALLCGAVPAATLAAPVSQCYGSVSNGRLEAAVKLPERGPNFAAYSKLGVTVNRTWVHSSVAAIVQGAYAELARSVPSMVFVYGETGFPDGGRFKPHRSHQNGLSVDFFVPVRTSKGEPAILPSTLKNRFGYKIEFDAEGRAGDYRIDFDAYAEHLYQLHKMSLAQGAGITLAIVDPEHLKRLLATRRGAYLREHMPFMKTRPWVRHDEHFHIDFAIPCKPLHPR